MIKHFKSILSKQKGAMFGMDARIALGAFAALAVIVGYQVTTRVGMAEYGTLLKEMRAVETAMMNMQGDMGVFYDFAVDNDGSVSDPVARVHALFDVDLVADNFSSRWAGPYLDKDPAEGFIRVRSSSNASNLNSGDMEAYPNTRDINPGDIDTDNCNLNNDCYMWLRRLNVPQEYFDEINAIVDEQNGEEPETNPETEGRIRRNNSDSLDYRTEVVRRP